MQPVVDLSHYSQDGIVRVTVGDEPIASIALPLLSNGHNGNGNGNNGGNGNSNNGGNGNNADGTPPTPSAADPVYISKWADSLGKRAFDLVVGSVLFAAALPVMTAVALAIWVEDGGPIFFIQRRAGKGGKPFRFLKFRSMKRGAEKEREALAHANESTDGVIFKIKRDPRVTRVGTFIRRTSLDELPQIFNILGGTMSIVGPRPHPIAEAADYEEDARIRLATKPGVTCLWQIMGRSDIPFRQQVILDRLYLEHESLGLDVKILLKTVPAVLLGRGAY